MKLPEEQFHRLLEWLDADPEQAGSLYLRIRDELVSYFRRRAAWVAAEELADATIDRVASKTDALFGSDYNAEDASKASDKLPYFKAVARFIYLEYLNSHRSKATGYSHEEIERYHARRNKTDIHESPSGERKSEHELRFECMEECLAQLTEINRRMITLYYQMNSLEGVEAQKERKASDARQELASALGIPLNTLRVRLHRVRGSLRECLFACLGKKNRE
ncbi:MAG TPA: hypothetical protein VF666_16010 [Pyrinomonadaceae bacterium]|jgi:RNA polymerase sigma factor (sigma-70 family)